MSKSTWLKWSNSCASAADMSEGTIWLGTSGIVFTVGVDEKAFIPKLAVGKGP